MHLFTGSFKFWLYWKKWSRFLLEKFIPLKLNEYNSQMK